jgi:hypothetical protein
MMLDCRFWKFHERRDQVVMRLHMRGIGVVGIVALTGLRYPTTVRKRSICEVKGGWPSIKPALRGCIARAGRRFSAEQEAFVELTHVLRQTDHVPRQPPWPSLCINRLMKVS